MTEITITTPAQRRYSGQVLDSMQVMEFGAGPFTDAELDAIDRYGSAIEGIPDCFDPPGMGIGPVPEDFTPADVLGMIRAWFGMLSTWREAVVTLRDDLADRHADAPGVSTAAERYLGGELAGWHRAREDYRSGAIEHLLGKDRFGYLFDGAPAADGYRYADGMFWVGTSL